MGGLFYRDCGEDNHACQPGSGTLPAYSSRQKPEKFYLAQAVRTTKAFINYWDYGVAIRRLETNLVTGQWGSSTVGTITIPGGTSNVSISRNPGSASPGFIADGGIGGQSANQAYHVIATTKVSNKVVFSIYRIP